MKRFRPHLTYANVISTICLFLLIAGGTAFAATQLAKNSVGSNQLKKNAVTSAKLKKGAVTPAKLSSAAKVTLTGPQGAPGATGASGATHVVVRVGVQEVDSKAFCLPGEVAVGGGGSTPATEQLLWSSVPVDAKGEFSAEGGTPVGWFAGGETASGEPKETTAYVVCASP